VSMTRFGITFLGYVHVSDKGFHIPHLIGKIDKIYNRRYLNSIHQIRLQSHEGAVVVMIV
jgi:hypothetical protein